jgi:hypothetical protein
MDIKRLNDKLNNVRGVLNLDGLGDIGGGLFGQILSASDTLNALNQSAFTANKTGKSINGIKSVTESLPFVHESIANLASTAPIVELTAGLPGLENQMSKSLTDSEKVTVQQMSAAPWPNPDTGEIMYPKATDTSKIDGTKRANRLVGTPQSIQTNINNIAGVLPDFDKIMKGIVPPHLEEIALTGLNKAAALELASSAAGINLTSGLNLMSNLPVNISNLTDGLGGIAGGIINKELNNKIQSVNSSLNNIIKPDLEILTVLGILQNTKLAEEDHLTLGINSLAGHILTEKEILEIVSDLKDEKFSVVINKITSAAVLKNALSGVIVSFTNPDTGLLVTPTAAPSPWTNPDTGVQQTPQDIPAAQYIAMAEFELNMSIFQLQDAVMKLTTDLATNLVSGNQETNSLVTSPEIIIGGLASGWSGSSTTISDNRSSSVSSSDYKFLKVHSFDELVAEFNNVQREVTELIVHWTEHFLDQAHAGAEEVHKKCLALDLDGCAYHYIIKKNGQIERGRPVSVPGEHAPNHDVYSIAVAFVGGFNSYSTEHQREWTYGKESLTASQYKAFDLIIKAYLTIWPGCNVFGHNDLIEWSHDPGFDVQAYVKNKFGVTNQSDPAGITNSLSDLHNMPIVSTDAVTSDNKPKHTIVVPAATIHDIADAVQHTSASGLIGIVPRSVHGYDEIINLLNNNKVQVGDIFNSTQLQTNDIVTAVRNDILYQEAINAGYTVAVATQKSIEIITEDGSLANETNFA